MSFAVTCKAESIITLDRYTVNDRPELCSSLSHKLLNIQVSKFPTVFAAHNFVVIFTFGVHCLFSMDHLNPVHTITPSFIRISYNCIVASAPKSRPTLFCQSNGVLSKSVSKSTHKTEALENSVFVC